MELPQLMTVPFMENSTYCVLGRGTKLAATRMNTRAIDRAEIIKSEWTVLVGEFAVAIGSIIVVVGLIRAFRVLLKDNTE